VELTIEKLVYGGDGLARIPAGSGRAKSVFVPYVLPSERVTAAILEERPGFARGRLERVLQASPLRTQPPCPYFGKCGGCHYQHTSYDEQLRLKSEILRETLRRTAKIDLDIEIKTHASPPLNYRNRTRFHLRHQPEFAIGYFHHGSHELLPIRECPISAPIINRILLQLWSAGEAREIPAGVNEIEVFADASDEHAMIALHLRSGERDEMLSFARRLSQSSAAILGVSSFKTVESASRAIASSRSELLCGEPAMRYEVAAESYRVTAGSFFQTNRHLARTMVELAVGERRGRLALDLYSGVGLFAVPLASRFERVIAVESSQVSARDLRENAPANVKVSTQSSEDYLTSAAGTLKSDLVVVDPPRAGLGSKMCTQLSKLSVLEMVYVSCDPATLARDLRQLTTAGWHISAMHLIDLFPQTFHIESVTILRR
jgi:23S rRNA (uracil1939-C5)-methyltransferase